MLYFIACMKTIINQSVVRHMVRYHLNLCLSTNHLRRTISFEKVEVAMTQLSSYPYSDLL